MTRLHSSAPSTIPTTLESLASLQAVPKVIIFDLDNTLWTPELYQIRQRTPPVASRDIRLFPASREVLQFLNDIEPSHPLYGVELAIASRTSKGAWAEQLLNEFSIGTSPLRSFFRYIEIRTGSKKKHLADIRAASGVPYSSMLFFDDDARMNLGETSQLGVLSCHTPRGLTTEHFVKALHKLSELKANHDDQHWMGYILDANNLHIQESTIQDGTKCSGRVKFYSPAKRFGFVVDEATGAEYFVHESKVPSGIQLQTGDRVDFEANTEGQGRPSATILRGASNTAPKDEMVAMPCFTMSQPFAALLLNGIKTVESRNNPMFQDVKPGTRILLHCGRKDWHDLKSFKTILQEKGMSSNEIQKASNLRPRYDRGCVIGVVTIGKTWMANENELNSNDLQKKVLAPASGIGKFCTEIVEAQWLSEPIRMQGNPGVFTVEIPKRAVSERV
jgi:magnesium-dependent phosphatase 1